MNYHRFSKPFEELALKFVPLKGDSKKRSAAFYYPISGRVELKKNRPSNNREINRFLNESTIDVISFRLREPNTNELKKMDLARSGYDPMEYDGEDEEVEEEDNEEKVDEKEAEENEQETEQAKNKGSDA